VSRAAHSRCRPSRTGITLLYPTGDADVLDASNTGHFNVKIVVVVELTHLALHCRPQYRDLFSRTRR
jgi:hypothetical protein